MMTLQLGKELIVAALFSGLGTSAALAQHDAMQGGSAPADARDSACVFGWLPGWASASTHWAGIGPCT